MRIRTVEFILDSIVFAFITFAMCNRLLIHLNMSLKGIDSTHKFLFYIDPLHDHLYKPIMSLCH